MNRLPLTKYGPFIVGKSLPFTGWRVQSIFWDKEQNVVELSVQNGMQDIIKKIPYNENEHKENSLILNDKERKIAELKKIEDKLLILKEKLFHKKGTS